MKFSKGKRGEADQKLREKKKVGLAIYAYKLSTVRGMNHRLISEDITDITGVDFGIKGVENLFSQKINPAIRTFPPKAAGKGANPPKDFEKAREEVNAVLIKGGYGSLEHIVKDQRKRRKMSFKEISEWLKRTAKGFVISEENLENLYNNLSG